MKKITKILALSVLSLSCLAACSNSNKTSGGANSEASNVASNTASGKKVKVGLITLHDEQSTYDKNFIESMKAACQQEGAELVHKSGIDEKAECYDAAAELADDGCDFVFADSFGHENFMIQAAREFPKVQFGHATGTQSKDVNLANFHNAFASIYEGRYLAGVAAGLKLKDMIDNNKLPSSAKQVDGNYKLGYVGAYTYAEVVSGYTSWYLGVKSVVSNVQMDVQFTGSWYDESAEKEAANALISAGAAVISQHADSMGAPSACELAGVPNVSYNGSTASQCPDTFIVSSKINWTPYFTKVIKAIKAGQSFETDYCGSLEDGMVELTAVGTAAAAGTQEKINEMTAKLKAGTVKVFDTANYTVGGQHQTTYLADLDGDHKGDTEALVNGVFAESSLRSAPYFDVQIDGITLLNTRF